MKKCSKCHIEKELDCFGKKRDTKCGLNSACRVCVNISKRVQYQKNKERILKRQAIYRKENPEKRKAIQKKYRQNNKEKIKEINRKYTKENIDAIKKTRSEYYLNNKEIIGKKYEIYKNNNPELVKEINRKYYNTHKEQIKKYRTTYCQENKEQIKKYRDKYFKENKEKIKEKNRVYVLKNPEKRKKTCSDWQKNNKGIVNANTAKRRANKIKATPPWSELEKIKELYSKAKWLEELTGLKYHIDHVIPLNNEKVSGLHVWNNLQILEANANIKKSNLLE